MQRIEISIKASGSEPLALVFLASDSAQTVADRLKLLTWLVGQLDGHAESRRRASRVERQAPSALPEPPVEA